MSLKKLGLVTAVAVGVLASVPAAAQFAKTDEAIKYRQSAFFMMGQHLPRLGAMANGKVAFDAKVAQENAEVLLQLSKLPWAAFGEGTEGGKSKPAIWEEQEKFKDLAGKFQAQAVKLAEASKTGNLDSLKAAFGDTAASCKACHDSFRNR